MLMKRMRVSIFQVVLAAAMALTAAAATIYVPDDHATIQGAIDAASNGDTVIVKRGTYFENINFQGKAITVKSSDGPEVTVIDGSQEWKSVVTFEKYEGRDSILDGFTITNGCGNYVAHLMCGGGICCISTSPTIINNMIRGNLGNPWWVSCDYGGGIYCGHETPLISNNIIFDNIALLSGGGIYCNWSNPIIKNNILLSNWTYGSGGGIGSNSRGRGIDSSVSILSNNIIQGNRSEGKGGGIWTNSSWIITNNTILNNSADCYCGGIYGYPGELTISNSIIWNNTAPISPEIHNSPKSITYSDIRGGWPGTGNIDADPLFVDPSVGDVHLTYNSPCRDAGDSTIPGLPDTDFEGDPRISGSAVDMGADEFHTHLYYTDGYLPERHIDIKVVGLPGTSAVTLALSSDVRDPPLVTPYGDFYLQPPLTAKVPLGPIPAEGVLVRSGTYPDSWVPGSKYHFQALVGPAAPGSELTNLMTLTVWFHPPPVARPKW